MSHLSALLAFGPLCALVSGDVACEVAEWSSRRTGGFAMLQKSKVATRRKQQAFTGGYDGALAHWRIPDFSMNSTYDVAVLQLGMNSTNGRRGGRHDRGEGRRQRGGKGHGRRLAQAPPGQHRLAAHGLPFRPPWPPASWSPSVAAELWDPHLVLRDPERRKQELLWALQSVRESLDPKKISSARSPHFPHRGKSKTIPVKYEVRKGPRGLGLFLAEPVKKGRITWRFHPEDHFEIWESDMPMLTRLLEQAEPEVATWFVRWTYPYAWYCHNCMLLELDDGRYGNDAYEDPANIGGELYDPYDRALMDLPAGTELLESYEKMDKTMSWFWGVIGKYVHNTYVKTKNKK